jgi:hypothetical protein
MSQEIGRVHVKPMVSPTLSGVDVASWKKLDGNSEMATTERSRSSQNRYYDI